ncbi:MAG: DUF4097 family beta strand repeat-containing protein [Vulcanimicrobiaceae bacterium]
MRTPLIAMLIAAEVFLVGLMIYAVKGGHAGWVSADAAGFPWHEANFKAAPIAPLAAGLSPDVSIDDRESHVTVDVSNDGLVHIQDLTSASGMMWGSATISPLHVERTASGVSITRPGNNSLNMSIGDVEQEIRVDVPAGSHVTIGHASGAEVTGIAGGANVTSQDGRIVLQSLRGDVTAHSDDGRIEATDVNGGNVALSTDDGRLRLSNVAATSLDASTEDGSIQADRLAVSGSGSHAVVHTDDGSITAVLQTGSNATVVASTNDGRVTIDGNTSSGDSNAEQTVKVGDGSAQMRLSSDDGSIHLTTNGAQ